MEIHNPFLDPETSHVSTGNLPESDQVARLTTEAHNRFGSVISGQN